MVETGLEGPPPAESAVWLVMGLGNPGPDYEGTYHNVGFRVVDRLARRWDVSLDRRVGEARVGVLGDQRRVLVQPQTFMNLSGSVLAPLFGRFGGESRLLVICDDVALPVGRIRIRERGSAGGHNGLKSIGSALGSDRYIRVRVGILPAGTGDRIVDTRDYVLSRIRKSHRELLGRCEDLAADAVEDIVSRGVGHAMSKYNGQDLRPDAPE